MKEFFKSIKRAPFQSLAIFLILFFTVFLSTLIFFGLTFLYSFLNYIETRPQVTVYFQNTASTEQIFKLRDELIKSGKVLSIKYISKEEAFNIYKNMNKDNPLLLEMVSADILPPSLEIYANKPVFLPQIAEYLKKQPGVDEVVFQKDIVDKLTTVTNTLRLFTVFFFGFLILMTTSVLLVIFSFKIALKKEEIHLLQLMGATKNYIRAPFLKEASFFGLITSLTSFSIIFLSIIYFSPFLNSYFRGIESLSLNFGSYTLTVWPINHLFLIITFLISSLFSILIAVSASFLAINKYLE